MDREAHAASRETDIRRSSWIDSLAGAARRGRALPPGAREALSRLDDTLFDIWGLGDNIILVWTCDARERCFLAVRHYAVIEATGGDAEASSDVCDAGSFVNGVLAGPKRVARSEFERICRALGNASRVHHVPLSVGDALDDDLVTRLVTRYGVSLVRERAVLLLDSVGFSLRSPLEQVAMLNSLSYSVNSAYRQLLAKDVRINFARTNTGDGFYVWNRSRSADANADLYKLTMLILADNAVAQRKARRFPVPRLRAAFHVGKHYEFYQVEALNPTTFAYIVGQVTIELSRMIEQALPGQILIGDFSVTMDDGGAGQDARHGSLDFVERTAATLDELKGLTVSEDRVETIRCYLTGRAESGGRFLVNRYQLRDKHGMTRAVYNAKINIHLRRSEPIFLGVQHKVLHPSGSSAPGWPPRTAAGADAPP